MVVLWQWVGETETETGHPQTRNGNNQQGGGMRRAGALVGRI